ncbi:MAG: hypothetical protein GY858_04220 [Candidatus Omnitrophica bacterium]|nr:hypothetical protein [Candidatus Omnitrophota bacterium]
MVILTRRKHSPPVLYVNDTKQAKTFYAAVESVKRAGTEVGITKDIPVRMVGANPFIAKLKHVFHLENFEECLRTNPQTKMLVVNTDHFGSKKSIKITPYDNFATWEGMGRPNSIEVEYDKLYGNYRGVSINGVPKELLDRHGLYAPGELEKINKEEIMPGRKAYFRRLLPGFKPKFKGKKTSDTHPFKLRKK